MTSMVLATNLSAETLHRELTSSDTKTDTFTWQVPETVPFDELLVSWNAVRPSLGEYAISIKVKCNDWSEELSYAVWAANLQRTFASESSSQQVCTNEDTIELLNGAKATGFSVKVEARNGASLAGISCLHAAFCDVQKTKAKNGDILSFSGNESIILQVPARSQMALKHTRNDSFCSPTATSALVSYLAGKDVPALDFAVHVWDEGSDIYGNWIFNIAESFERLRDPWRCYVARLDSFEPIYERLKRGIPSVVSVRGPLHGSAMPYDTGHLIAIIGYDAESKSIICIDPAFPTDAETIVRYEARDFLQAWCRRGQIAYLFEK